MTEKDEGEKSPTKQPVGGGLYWHQEGIEHEFGIQASNYVPASGSPSFLALAIPR